MRVLVHSGKSGDCNRKVRARSILAIFPLETAMIFDLRTYTCHPGKAGEWLKLYEEKAYAIQAKYLGKPLFVSTSEVGTLNQVVHCWVYTSQADREQRRTAMEQDPGWHEYRRVSGERGYIARQDNTILKSAPFSPL